MVPDRIRPAVSNDAEAIAAVHVASWHATYDGLLTDDQRWQVTVRGRTAVWEARLHGSAPSPDVIVSEPVALPRAGGDGGPRLM